MRRPELTEHKWKLLQTHPLGHGQIGGFRAVRKPGRWAVWARLTLVLFAGFMACGPPGERPDCFKPAGSTGHEHRPLPAFSTLEVHDNVQVVLSADGQPFGADLTGGRNLLSEVNTELEDGKMVIRNQNKCNFVRSQKRPIVVTIHLPDSAIHRRFTVLHKGEEPIRSAWAGMAMDTIFLFQLNIGDTDLDISSTYVWIGLYEYGDIILHGQTRELIATASGVGFLRAENFRAENAYVKGYRDSHLYVRASNNIGVELFGRGNGYWYGNPPNTDLRAYDKGQIIRGGD